MSGQGETVGAGQEGSLEAPVRYPIDWRSPNFRNEEALNRELERVFDICHGCRRCVSLCHAFPTLFDLVDSSSTCEVDGVAPSDYGKVVEHCYLCDLCYLTKCPYVPPHEWAVDFPHLMLRAKVVRFEKGESRLRDRLLTSTDTLGSLAGIPVVAQAVNAVTQSQGLRRIAEKTLGVAAEASLPRLHGKSLRRRLPEKVHKTPEQVPAQASISAPPEQFPKAPVPAQPSALPREQTPGQPPKTSQAGEQALETGTQALAPAASQAGEQGGRVLIYVSCYGNHHAPQQTEDLLAVLEHNDVQIALMAQEKCCGMPKLELGDLRSVEKNKDYNIPRLHRWVQEGWLITSPIPSCVLMFSKELPLLFPDDAQVAEVAEAFRDPFDYLMLRHREQRLKTHFRRRLGKVVWHVACHQRVQNIGPRTQAVLQLVPNTEVEVIARCSGHDGIYACRAECHDIARKICRPVAHRVEQSDAEHYISDCPMAADLIDSMVGKTVGSPLSLLRYAYGL